MTTSTTLTTLTTSTAVLDHVESVGTIGEPTAAEASPMAGLRLLAHGRPKPDEGSVSGRRPAHYLAPSRFDVHAVADFEAWVAQGTAVGGRELVVDCSRIDFVDAAAVEVIERVDAEYDLALTDLSVAARVTFRLLDVAAETVGLPALAVAA